MIVGVRLAEYSATSVSRGVSSAQAEAAKGVSTIRTFGSLPVSLQRTAASAIATASPGFAGPVSGAPVGAC